MRKYGNRGTPSQKLVFNNDFSSYADKAKGIILDSKQKVILTF